MAYRRTARRRSTGYSRRPVARRSSRRTRSIGRRVSSRNSGGVVRLVIEQAAPSIVARPASEMVGKVAAPAKQKAKF